MDRTHLAQILDSAPGVQKADGGYVLADEHRASIYLGRGQATIIADVVRLALHEAHIEAEAKDRTLYYVSYEPVMGVAIRRPRQDGPRTGF